MDDEVGKRSTEHRFLLVPQSLDEGCHSATDACIRDDDDDRLAEQDAAAASQAEHHPRQQLDRDDHEDELPEEGDVQVGAAAAGGSRERLRAPADRQSVLLWSVQLLLHSQDGLP